MWLPFVVAATATAVAVCFYFLLPHFCSLLMITQQHCVHAPLPMPPPPRPPFVIRPKPQMLAEPGTRNQEPGEDQEAQDAEQDTTTTHAIAANALNAS